MEAFEKLREYCFKTVPGEVETKAECFERSLELKQHVKREVERLGGYADGEEESRVLIVTHSALINALREEKGVNPETGKFYSEGHVGIAEIYDIAF